MEVINLNLIPSGALPVVHASQYDEGRTFRANLMDGSTVYTLDGTEVLECDVKKPDGNIVTVAVANTSDSFITIDTTLQMCACAGESLAELHITKGAQEIGTLNFILAVERSPLEGGIQSDSGIHNLQTQIGEAVAEQYAAEDVVFDAAPVAGHGTGFAVTSEGVKTYVEGEIAALTIPEELDDLSDVTTSAPSSGEALVWDGSKWTNGTVSTVGSIDDLNDVDTTGKAEGDSLRYDSGSGDWVAKPIVIEVTQAEYDQLVLDGDLQPLTTYVITDAPNLNATANDLSMGSAPYASGTVGKAITELLGGYVLKEYTGTMPTSKTNKVDEVDTGVAFAYILSCEVYNSQDTRYDALGIGTVSNMAYITSIKRDNGTYALRPYILTDGGLTLYNGAQYKAVCLVKYS